MIVRSRPPVAALLALGAALLAADARTPVAVLDGEVIHKEDVEGAVAFRIYRHEVDIYSLLRSEAERRVDELLLSREAARRGVEVEALLEAVMAAAAPATEEEVDRYLEEHPAEEAAAAGDVRARVRHFLGERRRIEKRIAFLDGLREAAGYRFVYPPPEVPRTEVDVAGAPARGPEEAPVTIVHFASFGSRHSARSAGNLRRLAQEFPEQLRFVHRNLLNDRDERGLLAARLGHAAQDAGRFWPLHDAWFARAGKLDLDAIAAIAVESGLGVAEVERARSDPALLRRVKRDIDAANAAGALREPTLFVNGRYVAGISPYEEVRSIVADELAAVRDDGRGAD